MKVSRGPGNDGKERAGPTTWNNKGRTKRTVLNPDTFFPGTEIERSQITGFPDHRNGLD
jgi:hypothetical protein